MRRLGHMLWSKARWVTRVEGWWILLSCIASEGGVRQFLKQAAAIRSNTVK